MHLPLQGVRVVELCNNIAGPYAGLILAALGADVVKVERPGSGDDARGWGPPFWRDASTVFQSLNRDKRSVVVDLKKPAAIDALKTLIVAEADVVVQSLRPGVVDELGLDAKSLLAAQPRLIYCNLHAFGAKGPMAKRPGYDALMQGFGGIMSMTGEPEGRPVRAGVSIVDEGTGMWCAIGILAALNRRQQTGKGGLVDTSLFETALGWMHFYGADYQATGEVPQRQGSGARGITPYRGFPCADGDLIVAAPNDRLFRRLSGLLDRPEWADDPKFATSGARAVNRDELNGAIADILRHQNRAHWQALLDEDGIPNAPIQSIDEVLAHPQAKALGLFQDTGVDGMALGGLPISFDGERPPLRNLAPAIGADTDDVFGDAAATVRPASAND